MLANDSVTVAVEVPVFLSEKDILYYRSIGFNLDFQSAVITGHIDFLQIRNGYIHILDYKPDARREKHAHVQLTIYALALARRTGLPLRVFKCGWFDEKDYFEFFPLQAVRPRRTLTLPYLTNSVSCKLHDSCLSMENEAKLPS
jgi:ATP-dependent exoDNAse (exonuclease V) beta subunit